MQERIQKILADCGIASRRQAEKMIQDGRVLINGNICSLGMKADRMIDQILVDGEAVQESMQKIYIMLHKPRGYVTTVSDEKQRRTVLDLIDCGHRIYPVGRLDMDSEGLLLLTNDGELTNKLIHPSNHINKTYLVWLNRVTTKGLREMAEEMVIDGYSIQPAQIKVLWRAKEAANIQMVIHEGRNRQIRRMAENCGMYVTRLRRIEEAGLQLGNLERGTWRYLTESEIIHIKSL